MSQKCRILSAGIGRIQRPKRAQRIAEYIPPRRRGIGQNGHLKKGNLFAFIHLEECTIIHPS
jgi:hypothetical protein